MKTSQLTPFVGKTVEVVDAYGCTTVGLLGHSAEPEWGCHFHLTAIRKREGKGGEALPLPGLLMFPVSYVRKIREWEGGKDGSR